MGILQEIAEVAAQEEVSTFELWDTRETLASEMDGLEGWDLMYARELMVRLNSRLEGWEDCEP